MLKDDKENSKQKNAYDDGNIPEIDLPASNGYEKPLPETTRLNNDESNKDKFNHYLFPL